MLFFRDVGKGIPWQLEGEDEEHDELPGMQKIGPGGCIILGYLPLFSEKGSTQSHL